MSTRHRIAIATAICVFILTIGKGVGVASANEPPVAEAGLPRYAAADPVRLDGTGSCDPDGSGPVTYSWRQLSGPAVTITDVNAHDQRQQRRWHGQVRAQDPGHVPANTGDSGMRV